MNAPVSLQQRVADYIAERRRLGFDIRARGSLLAGFARYVAERGHTGPLTADLRWTGRGRTNGVAGHRAPGPPAWRRSDTSPAT